VSHHDFLFALRLSASGGFDAMLEDLTGAVLRHVGYHAEALDSLGGEVKAAVAAGGRSDVDYHVRFRAHDGSLEVVVSQSGRDVARIIRRLPS
jgi:hypothetical protein